MQHHILAIGISKHQNSSSNLAFASDDAIEFFNLFTNNIDNIGYKKLLIDQEATLSQIRTALGTELKSVVKPEDAFFFFYSGHGAVDDSQNGGQAVAIHYLVPFDATPDIQNSCVSVDYLKSIFEKLQSKANLIFIDSCFSGSLSKNSKSYPLPKKKDFKQIKSFTNTVIGTGSLTFTASKDDEEAIEDPEFKRGLFTHFLLEELKKDRKGNKLPILDIFTPITEGVTRRAKEKYNYIQTPTLNSHLEGNVYLPPFKNRIAITQQALEISIYPELASISFPMPDLQIEDKQLEKIVNESIKFVMGNAQNSQNSVAEVIFERHCAKLMKKLIKEWDGIFSENGGRVSEIPTTVSNLEAASFPFILLGSITAVFGSEKQVEIYSQHAVQLLEITKNKAGLIALTVVPEIILIEIVYILGVLCIARKKMRPFDILLKTDVVDYLAGDQPPRQLIDFRHIHYCQALGGSSVKVNDHIREILKNSKFLPELVPKLEDKTLDFQLQTNFLLVMLMLHRGNGIWADFGRFYAEGVMELIKKIKYDIAFRKQIADMFEVKEQEIMKILMDCLGHVTQLGLDNYPWLSIEVEHLLTVEERRELYEKR